MAYLNLLSAAPLNNFCGLVHISKIMPEVTAWQNRPLEAVYPFVFMDAIHYKVKKNNQYQTKAAYVTENEALENLMAFKEKWGKQYPDDSLRKMLCLASRKIVEHWTARCQNWDVVLSQLQLMFQDRLTA